jgi:hypothetical protein
MPLKKISFLGVRTSWIKMFYCMTLRDLTHEQVHAFWSRIPLTIDSRTYQGAALYEYLWREEGMTPSTWNIPVLNEMQRYYAELGKNAEESWKNACREVLFTPKGAVWIIDAMMRATNRLIDMRDFCIKFGHLANSRMAPGSCLRSAPITALQNGSHSAVFAFTMDASFKAGLECVDSDWFMPIICNYTPTALGGKPMDGYTINAVERSAMDIVDPSFHPAIRNNTFYINNEPYGRITGFLDLLNSRNLSFHPLKIPDRQVILMDRDWSDPLRPLSVLRKGVAYGAPLLLFTVFYKGRDRSSPGILWKAAKGLMDPHKTPWAKIEVQHREFLRWLAGALHITFDIPSETVSIDGRHVTSGVQARILRRILELHLRDGRTGFERREFTTDINLISSPLDTGFAVRMKRISNSLASTCPALRIVRSGRGKFRLECDRQIEFKEK